MRGYPGNARHQPGTRAHTCGSQLLPMRRAAGGAGNPTRAESSAHVLGPPLPLRERFRRAQRHSAGHCHCHCQGHLRPRGCRLPPGGPGSRDGREGGRGGRRPQAAPPALRGRERSRTERHRPWVGARDGFPVRSHLFERSMRTPENSFSPSRNETTRASSMM